MTIKETQQRLDQLAANPPRGLRTALGVKKIIAFKVIAVGDWRVIRGKYR